MMCYPLDIIMVIPSSYLKMRYEQHLRNKGCRYKPGCSMFGPPATLFAYSAFSCWSYALSCNLQYQIQYKHSNWTIHDMSPTAYDANEAIKSERESLETEPRYLVHDIYSIRCKMKSNRKRGRECKQAIKSLPHRAVLWLRRQLQAAKSDFRH